MAFGATRFAKKRVEEDPSVQAIIEAETPVVSIFGKSWDLHVRRALGIREEENLKMIAETVRYLKDKAGKWSTTPSIFSTATMRIAISRCVPWKPRKQPAPMSVPVRYQRRHHDDASLTWCAEVRKRFDGVLGIHTHNDADWRWPTRWRPSKQGFTHVQGCINGYGERCGNANLTSVIANLELKLGHTTIGQDTWRISLGFALHRRTGQSAHAQRSGLRGPQRVRAQGRRARERGAERFGDL